MMCFVAVHCDCCHGRLSAGRCDGDGAKERDRETERQVSVTYARQKSTQGTVSLRTDSYVVHTALILNFISKLY